MHWVGLAGAVLACAVPALGSGHLLKVTASGRRWNSDGLYSREGTGQGTFYRHLQLDWLLIYPTEGGWALGSNGKDKTPEGAKKVLRNAVGAAGLPPQDGWVEVWDGSLAGRAEGSLRQDMRVIPVSGNFTKEQLEREEDVQVEGGIFCLTEKEWTGRLNTVEWTIIEYDDPKYCDGREDCKHGGDELNWWDASDCPTPGGPCACPCPREELLGGDNVTCPWRAERWRSTSEEDTGEGLVCAEQLGKWALLSTAKICDGKQNCLTARDETNCPLLVAPPIGLTFGVVLGIVVIGILVFVGYEWSGYKSKGEHEDKAPDISLDGRTELEVAVDTFVAEIRASDDVNDEEVKDIEMVKPKKNCQDILGNNILSEGYSKIHATPGGVKLLVGATFTFVACPKALHRAARRIQAGEEIIHDSRQEWLTCARGKLGSDMLSVAFLESLDPPGFAKLLKFRLDKIVNSVMYSVIALPANKNRSTMLWYQIKLVMVKGLPSLLTTSFYLLDYVKDIIFFLYLVDRLPFMTDPSVHLLRYLVYFHGFSIVLAGITVGWALQYNEAIMDLSSIKSVHLIRFLRLLIFIFALILPVFVILRALSLSVQTHRLVADGQDSSTGLYTEGSSVSKVFRHYKMVDRKRADVMAAYSDMKMVETNLEGVPQLFLLVTFTIASVKFPDMSGLGLLKDNSTYTWAFLILSIVQTFSNMISSVLTGINVRKQGQLGAKAKGVLGLSVAFQILARIILMVGIARAALPDFLEFQGDDASHTVEGLEIDDAPGLGTTHAAVLLALPIPLHWLALLLLHCWLDGSTFWLLPHRYRILHLLSNSWVTVPVRRIQEQHQVHKAREQLWSLVLALGNIVVTIIATAASMDKRNSLPFLVIFGLPAILCHTFGALFVKRFYKSVHPWREIQSFQASSSPQAEGEGPESRIVDGGLAASVMGMSVATPAVVEKDIIAPSTTFQHLPAPTMTVQHLASRASVQVEVGDWEKDHREKGQLSGEDNKGATLIPAVVLLSGAQVQSEKLVRLWEKENS